jgi:dUTP pyrophosphatase
MNQAISIQLKDRKLHPDVSDFSFASEESACFDLRAYFAKNATSIDGFNADSQKISNQVITQLGGAGSANNRAVVVNPGERMMISTGVVFDIPVGYSVRVHARSGLALKAGLVMANAEGIIDSDYTEETKILVLNISNIPIRINHGDRIAQAEMVPVLSYDLVSTTEDINQKTSRAGGFGSTGIS